MAGSCSAGSTPSSAQEDFLRELVRLILPDEEGDYCLGELARSARAARGDEIAVDDDALLGEVGAAHLRLKPWITGELLAREYAASEVEHYGGRGADRGDELTCTEVPLCRRRAR